MRVLVTGGAGFIGTYIVEALADRGDQVRVLDALLPAVHRGREPELPSTAEFIRGDVRDQGIVAAALRGVDVVCHQAAMVGRGGAVAESIEYAQINDVGTAVLLTAMANAGLGRLVLASSAVVYGEGRYTCPAHGDVSPGPRAAADMDAGVFDPPCPHCGARLTPGAVDEDGRVSPRNIYGATKMAQEHLVAAWARETGGSAAALRYHHVYGPGMRRDSPYSGVTATFRSAAANGARIRVFEDGAMMRDFVHVRDIAQANVAALDAGVPGFRAYNVASGTPRTVADLADAIAAAAAAPTPEVTGEYRFDDVRHIVATPERLVRELGWRPTVEFKDGIAEFVAAPILP
jgi:dTDP-L-rhamnose 4-epimerase